MTENKGEKVGSKITKVGCILTLCITVPVILFIIALVMCGNV